MRPSHRLPKVLSALVAVALLGVASAASAAAPDRGVLKLTDRQVDAAGNLNVAAAGKLADKLLAYDTEAQAPIYLMISATQGSAQGVMLLADTIRALQSPVVAVIVTQVHGAGAALAMFTDRALIYPSAGLVFTDIEYEGVKKIEPPEPPDAEEAAKAPEDKDKDKAKPAAKKKDKEPTAEEKLLQQARSAYLDRFWAALAKRMYLKTPTLTQRIADGGFVVTPAEAVKGKLAYQVVDRLSFTPLPSTKREYKVTTTEKKVKSTGPLLPDAPPESQAK